MGMIDVGPNTIMMRVRAIRRRRLLLFYYGASTKHVLVQVVASMFYSFSLSTCTCQSSLPLQINLLSPKYKNRCRTRYKA
jgi:hypothetical protein